MTNGPPTAPSPAASSEWSATPAGATGSEGLWTYLRPILAYWWLVAPLAALGGALGLTYSYYVPPRYRAQCRFEIFENEMLRIGEFPATRDNPYYFFSVNPIERHILLLTSRNLDERVRRKLADKWGRGGKYSDPVALSVTPVEQAARVMVDISVDSPDSNYALDYIRMLLEEYQALRREEIGLVHEDTIQSLRAELAKLGKQLNEARRSVTAFEAEHNVQFEERRNESDLEHMRNILRKGRSVQTQRTILESQLKLLGGADAATLRDALDLTMFTAVGDSAPKNAKISETPAWTDLPKWEQNEGDLVRLQEELRALGEICRPEHPKLVELRDKIAAIRREQQLSAALTMKRLHARLDALRAQETALEEAAAKVKAGLRLTAADRAEYESLRASADHFKTLYDKVFSRIIDSTSAPRDRYFSRIVEGPFAWPAPVWPVKWRMVALSMLAAAAAGILIAFLLYFRYMRMYSLEHVEAELGLPTIGSIPLLTREALRQDPRAINSLHKADPICEAYRIVRTGIEEHLDGGHIALITSPEQSEGKTLTSACTTMAAAWSKAKVLLVDGDFRKPAQSKLFQLPADALGFADCLTAEPKIAWRDCIVADVAPNLDILPAGRARGHGAELLETGPVQAILDELREEYQLIIVDSAPVNQVLDTVLLARRADVVLLVVQPGRTPVSAIRRAVRRLANSKLIGYVANAVTASSGRYYSEYGHYSDYHSYDKRRYYYMDQRGS